MRHCFKHLPRAFEVFLLVASSIGAPIREISFFGWIMFACYCGLVVALLTGLVLGIVANLVRDGTFRETLQWAMLGTFISSLFTAGIFYFFQLGDRFIDATMGPQGQSSGFAGGLPGYVLLVIPGLLFCLYWLAFAWADMLAMPRASAGKPCPRGRGELRHARGHIGPRRRLYCSTPP